MVGVSKVCVVKFEVVSVSKMCVVKFEVGRVSGVLCGRAEEV